MNEAMVTHTHTHTHTQFQQILQRILKQKLLKTDFKVQGLF